MGLVSQSHTQENGAKQRFSGEKIRPNIYSRHADNSKTAKQLGEAIPTNS